MSLFVAQEETGQIDATGTYDAAFYIMGAMNVAVAACVLVMKVRPRPQFVPSNAPRLF